MLLIYFIKKKSKICFFQFYYMSVKYLFVCMLGSVLSSVKVQILSRGIVFKQVWTECRNASNSQENVSYLAQLNVSFFDDSIVNNNFRTMFFV